MPDFDDVITDLRAAGDAAATAGGSAPAPASAAESMLTWGQVAFGVSTASIDRLRRRTEYRWPAQARVGRRPSLQSVGPGADKITLDGVMFPGYRGDARLIRDVLAAAAAEGRALLLTEATGRVHGKWALESIDETRSGLFADGAPRRIEYSAVFSHYGDDAPAGRLDEVEDAANEAGDARAMIDVLEAATEDGADAVLSAARAAGAEADPKSALRRVFDAVSGAAARGEGARGLVDAAVGAAARLPGVPIPASVASVAYRAKGGDTLATIAHLRYGASDAIGSLLEANPGLGALDARLPAGTLVGLPESVELPAAATRAVRLWT